MCVCVNVCLCVYYYYFTTLPQDMQSNAVFAITALVLPLYYTAVYCYFITLAYYYFTTLLQDMQSDALFARMALAPNAVYLLYSYKSTNTDS